MRLTKPIAGLALAPGAAQVIRKLSAERVAGAPAEATVVKLTYMLAGRRAAKQALLGRYLDRDQPAKGRFTRQQVDRVLARTWETFDRLAPGAHVERLETHGARQNALLAVFALAVYRELQAEGVNAKYATELVTDLAWTVYQKWVIVPRLIARVASDDPQQQMNLMLRMFLRFPFNRPGYDWKAWTDESAYAIDFYRCPMRDYLRSQGEEEFMLNSLCTLDFALAQVMAKGGRYERSHTLSAGDTVCNMKWRADRLDPNRGRRRAATPPAVKRSDTTNERVCPDRGGVLRRHEIADSSLRGSCSCAPGPRLDPVRHDSFRAPTCPRCTTPMATSECSTFGDCENA